MKLNKRIKIIIICLAALLAACLVFVGVVGILFFTSFGANEMDGENLLYYKDIQKEVGFGWNTQITLDTVFTFEWDKAYIQADAGEPTEQIDAKLGFDSGLYAKDVWWGYPCRVIFIKDDAVVYEFLYDPKYLDFSEKEVFIYPDTVFIASGLRPISLQIET